MINARAETLTELPSFKLLVDRRRCIIPADGFYEWRKEGRRKIPMWVHLRSREPFGLAGLWDVWRKPDGKRVESFTIITTEPNELIQPIHNRMPVILRPEDEEQWLDASRTPFAKAKSLLKPYPEELLDAHDVSPIVNSAKYDGRSASDLSHMTRYPRQDSCLCCERQNHLITLSARASRLGGIVRSICFAALRLMINSNFFGCSIGRSAGLVPLRILST
jgi:SOS response associated peptidase (SRAP)